MIIDVLFSSFQYSGKQHFQFIFHDRRNYLQYFNSYKQEALVLYVSTYLDFCKVIESDKNLRSFLVNVQLKIPVGQYAYMRLV